MPTTTVGELQLCYDSRGEGEPLVLVMGLGAQMVLWDDRFCDALAAQGFRVIRFDNRDAGLSTILEDLGSFSPRRVLAHWLTARQVPAPYTIDDMADDTIGLLDALEIPSAHLVGISMGGMIVQAAAIRHPHRVRTLTSIMSHPGDRRSLVATPRGMRAILQKPARSRDDAIANHLRFFEAVSGDGFARNEDAIKHRAGLSYDRGYDPRAFSRQLAAIYASADRRSALRGLSTPAAVIHGSQDPVVRLPGGRRTAAALRNAEMLVLPGLGHELAEGAWPYVIRAIRRIANRG